MSDYTMVDLLNDEMKGLLENLPKIIEELKSEVSRLKQENETLYFEKENLKTYIQNHEEIWKRNAMIDKVEVQKKLLEELRDFFIEQTAYGCDANQHCCYYDYKVKVGDVVEVLDDFAKQRCKLGV